MTYRCSSALTDAAESHISTVVFAGDLTYKQLKAVKTPVLGYSTLEARRVALERELELNRRIAPDVYLGVTPVLADGEAIEYLLVMRRMPHDRRPSCLVQGPEAGEALRSVARRIAAFHAGLESDDHAIEVASVDAERHRWVANLYKMSELEIFEASSLDHIASEMSRYLDGRTKLFEQRARDGLYRDGHGDLLANDIFVLDDGPRILDCLAFDEDLRVGDMLADIAFLIMDIERLAGERVASALIRWYQEFPKEHPPSSLAHFYVAYRSLVRAKVGALRNQQSEESVEAIQHVAQAMAHLERSRLRLILVDGGPGTGKTILAEGIGAAMRAPVLSSDEIRKELAWLGHGANAPAEPDAGIYTPEMTERTYREILAGAAKLLEHGESASSIST